MGTLYRQTVEAVTPPALPTGWAADTGIDTVATGLLQGAKAFRLVGAGAGFKAAFYQTATDGNANTLKVTGLFNIDVPGTSSTWMPAWRYTHNVPANILTAGNGYRFNFQAGSSAGTWNLSRQETGVGTTTLGSGFASNSTTLGTASTYYYEIIQNTGSFSVALQRLSDGLWLNSSNAYQSGKTSFYTTTDGTPFTAAGYYGFRVNAASGTTILGDDLRLATLTDGSVSPTTATIAVGGTQTITASNFGGGTVTWTSATPSVATVNSSTGVVTGVSAGTAVITATGVLDAQETASSTVTVNTSPSVSPGSASLQRGATQQLTATNFTGGAVTWSIVSGTSATVSGTGLVTAVGAGATVVRATGVSNTGETATSTITGQAVTVSVSPTSASIAIGATQQLTPTVTGAVNTGVSYSSSNPAVATVNSSGLVTGVAGGSVTITITSSADGTVTTPAAISVIAAVAYPSNWRVPSGIKLYGCDILKGGASYTRTEFTPTGNATAEYSQAKAFSPTYLAESMASYEAAVGRVAKLGINAIRMWAMLPEACSDFSPPYSYYTVAQHAQHAVTMVRIAAKYGCYVVMTGSVGYIYSTTTNPSTLKLTFSQYATWITALVTALANEPNLIALDLMNEGFDYISTGNAATIINAARAADATLPLTISRTGASDSSYWATYDVAKANTMGLDFLQAHAYYDIKPSDVAPLEAQTSKPILIGEIGSGSLFTQDGPGRWLAAHDLVARPNIAGSLAWSGNNGQASGVFTPDGQEYLNASTGERITGYMPKHPIKDRFGISFGNINTTDMRYRTFNRSGVTTGFCRTYGTSANYLVVTASNGLTRNSNSGEATAYLSDLMAYPDGTVNLTMTSLVADSSSPHVTGLLFSADPYSAQVNRLFVGYSNSVGGGQWCVLRTSNGSTTTLGSAGSGLAAGTYILGVLIGSNGTTLTLQVNGSTLVGPLTLATPIKASQRLGILMAGDNADPLSPTYLEVIPAYPVTAEVVAAGAIGVSSANLSVSGGAGVTSREWHRYGISGTPLTTKTALSGQSGTNLVQSGLTTGQTYYYAVRSLDGTGNSRRSNEVAITPSATGTSSPAASYLVAGIPSAPVVGQQYVVTFVLDGVASASGVITPTVAAGLTWGSPAAIASGATSGSTTVSFSVVGSFTPAFTHTGLGFSGDPTLAAVSSVAQGGSGDPSGIAIAVLAAMNANPPAVNPTQLAGNTIALQNLLATMLADPVAVSDIATASATATATKLGTLYLNVGTMLASPGPQSTTFSANVVSAIDGTPITAGTGGFTGMSVIPQGMANFRRKITSHAIVGSRHDFVLDSTNPWPAGFAVAGMTFTIG